MGPGGVGGGISPRVQLPADAAHEEWRVQLLVAVWLGWAASVEFDSVSVQVLHCVLLKHALQHASVELLAKVSSVPLLFPPETSQHIPGRK